MKDGFYLAIEGNIGSGKTTLAEYLAEELQANLLLERFADNPFLADFYREPERYAFSVEMSFLADRYQQLAHLPERRDLFRNGLIADFAPFKSLLFAQCNLPEEEFKLYRQFWQMSLGKLPQPDALVFLKRPLESLLRNIASRGRSYEKQISPAYLSQLQAKYREYTRLHYSGPVLELSAEGDTFHTNSLIMKNVRIFLSRWLS